MEKINLIVPMVGYGARFRKAGYETFKPFIPIKGKFMIDYALEPFPEYVKKYLIVNPDLLTEEQITYLRKKKNTYIIEIEGHKNGPAFSVFKASKNLPLNESFFVSYSDMFWTWNFDNVKKLFDYDGIVFTRRKFHPHLVNNSYSAFCLPCKDNPNLMEAIKEKGYFTNNWMEEPLSMGTYYMKSGYDLIKTIGRHIKENARVDNEFYPSVIFNDLVKESKKVYLSDVDFYIHFGIPEQLEDFNNWVKVMKYPKLNLVDTNTKNICCMGGVGERMKKLSNTPKALLSIGEYPMFEFVLKEFSCNENILLTVNSVAKDLPSLKKVNYEIINLGRQTKSQLETLKKSVPYLEKNTNFFLTSCDAYGLFDKKRFHEFIKEKNPDAVVFTFTPTLVQRKLSNCHTYVSVSEDRISEVHIKNKSSNDDKGLAGFFWFKDGAVFRELDRVPKDKEHEMYIDHFLKYLVDTKRKVMAFRLDHYIHLGTMPEFLEYQFWQEFSDILLKD